MSNRLFSVYLMNQIFQASVPFKGALSDMRQFLATESPSHMIKNAFHFTLKVIFVLKISKFLIWLFGHVPANIRLDEDVFKTSWSRRIYSPDSYVFRRRLQDVSKTSSRHLQDVFKMFRKRLQDVFKTSSRCFQDVNCSWYHNFKRPSRRIQNVSEMYC